MKGIEKITGRILAEAQADAAAIKAEAEAKAAEIKAEYEEQARRLYDEKLETGRTEAAAAADRKSRAAVLQSRKDVLGTKQLLIDQAYALTKEAILDMPEEEYIAFLADKAAKASVSGTEKIVFNAADREKVGPAVVSEVNRKLLESGKKAEITLSEETMDIPGGLFLKEKDISVNCSVDTLMNICREEMDSKVAQALFG